MVPRSVGFNYTNKKVYVQVHSMYSSCKFGLQMYQIFFFTFNSK
jgi:hypothetical protein